MIVGTWNPDRLSNFEYSRRILERQGVDLRQFEAVKLEYDEFIRYEVEENFISFTDGTFRKDSTGYVVKPGHDLGSLGCTVSHISVITHFAREICSTTDEVFKGKRVLLLFEDDAVIAPDFMKNVDEVFVSAPRDFFFINLHQDLPWWCKYCTIFHPVVHDVIGKYTRATATLISCEGAQAIDDRLPAREINDLFMRRLYMTDNEFKGRVFMSKRPLVSTLSVSSERLSLD
jgi:GR25 family glycosyltransferase involved in LPS biosynthesis